METSVNNLQQPQTRIAPRKEILVVLCIVFLSVGFITGIVFSKYYAQPRRFNTTVNQQNQSAAGLSPTRSITETPQLIIKEIMQELTVDNERIIAYRLANTSEIDASDIIYAVALASDPQHSVLFSTVDPQYTNNQVFSLINKELWLINSQTNSVEIHTLQSQDKVNDIVQKNRFRFKKSLFLGQTGSLSSLSCDETICTVQTIFNKIICPLEINIKSLKTGSPKCDNKVIAL